MKLHKQLRINGERVTLNTDDVRLHLFNPGRAVFTVVSGEPVSGIVALDVGFDPAHLQQFFLGYVENSFAIDKKQQRVFCRELNAALSRLVPVSLRNVNLNQVLEAIATETGLAFVTPTAAYTATNIPAFYSLHSGYHCMDSLGQVFQIPQCLWQQQGDGKVFVGSWADSFWAGRTIELPSEWMASTGVANKARIPAVPKLRPGAQLVSGDIVTQVHLDGEHMNITWHNNPWGTRWTNRSSV